MNQKGKENFNYIDGRTMKKYYCIDCGIELSNYKAKRCGSCARTKEKHPMFGKKHTKTSLKKMSKSLKGKKKTFAKRPKTSLRMKTQNPMKNKNTVIKQLKNRKHSLHKHHLYLKCNKEILELTSSKHNSLHKRAYDYIYYTQGKKGIKKYLKWFDKKYKLRQL
jgi:hypothetical protein